MNNADLPGSGSHWIKLKGDQGWKNSKDNTIWKKDKLNRTGKKIKEIDFYGKQILPYGAKNKNKRP